MVKVPRTHNDAPALAKHRANGLGTWSAVMSAVLLLSACNWEPHLPQDAPEEAPPRPRIRVPDPVQPAAPGQSVNLLQHYAARDQDPAKRKTSLPSGAELAAEAPTWSLPFKSKYMVAALLSAVARDRLDDIDEIVHPQAQWGLPDPRMLRARPVYAGDDGEAFMKVLRQAASRFPEAANYELATDLHMGIQERLRTGAEPMWVYYENGLDRILFRMRVIEGRAWIDYVGMFEAAPTAPIQLRDKGNPPPMSPPLLRPDGSTRPSFSQGRQQPVQRQPPPGRQ